MDPRVKSNSYVRPKNDSGMLCPLHRKPTSQTCHKCELWQPLEVEVDGRSQVLWKCAFVWCASVQVITSHHLAGIQRAAEQTRNEVAANSQTQAAAVAGIVSLFEQLNGAPLQVAGPSRLIDSGG